MLKEVPNASSEWVDRGKTWRAVLFDIDKLDDIPDDHKPFTQVYAIAVLKGTMDAVIVTYDNGHDNLPGSTIENEESFEETLRCELNEEINAEVIDWIPLGYQRVTAADQSEPQIYQLRVLASVAVHTIFKRGHDIGGSVTGNKLVPLNKLAHTIKHGATGDHLQRRALKLIESRVFDKTD